MALLRVYQPFLTTRLWRGHVTRLDGHETVDIEFFTNSVSDQIIVYQSDREYSIGLLVVGQCQGSLTVRSSPTSCKPSHWNSSCSNADESRANHDQRRRSVHVGKRSRRRKRNQIRSIPNWGLADQLNQGPKWHSDQQHQSLFHNSKR